MALSPFAEIRDDYLKYKARAKWSALAAAAGTGVFFIFFLFLLGLAVDLLVNQGAIPLFHKLTPQQRSYFLQEKLPQTTEDVPREDWSNRLKLLGLQGERSTDLLLPLVARPDDRTLSPDAKQLQRELWWRWHVYEYLKEHVGEEASALISERTQELVGKYGPGMALTREIVDCGILSLVVRARYRADGWIAARIAVFNPWMWRYGAMTYLVGLLIVAVVLALVRGLLMFVNLYTAAVAATEAVTRLRRTIYHKTYRLGTLAFRALGPTEAVGVATRHLEAVHDGIYAWLTVWYREPIKFGLLLLFALLVNVWLALAFLLFAVLIWMVGGQIAAYFRKQGRQASQNSAEQLALLQESLMLMRLVRVYLMETFNQSRVERQLSRSARYQLRLFWGESIYRPLLVFLCVLAALGLLFICGAAIHRGQLSITGAILLVTALVSLYLPLQTWLDNRRYIRRAKESAAVLQDFLNRKGSVGQAVEATFLPPMSEALEFDNVSLKEPGTGRRLLENVSLRIAAGQRVAFVGPDDIEKYALVYLIPRFLDPASGEIRIDGKSLRWITLESLRAQIAIVLQHNLVFNDTVANNIGCGDRSYTLPQIIETAKIAHAHHFIQKLPKGYETEIGEMGHPLSLSEQYRIALARAIMRDPAIIIIEEPPIALDEEVKDLLDDTMHRVLPGRTVIFLPHRLSTIRNCDNVILIHKGRIVAKGNHKELLSESELYRHLQYLEFNEFAGILGPPLF